MKHHRSPINGPALKAPFAPSVLGLLTASLLLVSGAQGASLTWDDGGASAATPLDGFSSVWDTSATLWSNGLADSAWVNANNDTAVFGNNNGTAGTVALGSNITAAGLTFNAPTSGSYTIASGAGPYTLTLAGTPTITANVDAGISAVIAGSSGLTKSGAGTLTLSGANTYTGVTTINGGTLDIKTWVNGGLASSIGASATGTAGSPNLIINGGTLKFTGSSLQQATRIIGIGTSGATLDASGTINGATFGIASGSFGYVGSGARTLTLTGSLGGIQSAGGTIGNAVIADGSGGATSLVKNGIGSWSLGGVSTYTGSTTINAGVLFLVNGANRLPATTTLAVDTAGTFNLQGQDQTVAAITNGVNGGGIIINNAGNVSKTLTVGSGSFSGVMKDKSIGATSKLALTKNTTGTLTLSGANTYTGDTTITGGTLALGTNNVFAASNFVLNGGTLAVGTFTNTAVGTLSLTANSFITLGSGGSFIFADSHLLDWSSYTLSITGTFVDGSSIKFGSDANALTGAQLGLISINGGGAALNSSGFLIAAIPEPATYAALLGALALAGVAWKRRRGAIQG